MNWTALLKPAVEDVLSERIRPDIDPDSKALTESYPHLVDYVLYLRHEFRQYYMTPEAVQRLLWEELREDPDTLDLLMSLTQLFRLRFPSTDTLTPDKSYDEYLKSLAASRVIMTPEIKAFNEPLGDEEFNAKLPQPETIHVMLRNTPWLVLLLTLEDHLTTMFKYTLTRE